LKSGGIWPPALLHASHNLFVPGIFDNLVRDTGSTLWYTKEVDAALAISCSILALYFWTRRAGIENPAPKNTMSLTAIRDAGQDAGHDLRVRARITAS